MPEKKDRLLVSPDSVDVKKGKTAVNWVLQRRDYNLVEKGHLNGFFAPGWLWKKISFGYLRSDAQTWPNPFSAARWADWQGFQVEFDVTVTFVTDDSSKEVTFIVKDELSTLSVRKILVQRGYTLSNGTIVQVWPKYITPSRNHGDACKIFEFVA